MRMRMRRMRMRMRNIIRITPFFLRAVLSPLLLSLP
jgi:hypothetical protein